MGWVQKGPPVRLSLREVSTVVCMMCMEEIDHMVSGQICWVWGHKVSLEREQDEESRGLGRPSLV